MLRSVINNKLSIFYFKNVASVQECPKSFTVEQNMTIRAACIK